MIDEKVIYDWVERIIAGADLFVVELKLKTGNAIELVLDGDTGITVGDCARVNRELCEALEAAGIDDFELTVFSAGLNQPLKLKRQYIKNIGREMEAVLKSGKKIKGVLTAVTDDSVELEYTVTEKSPDRKRKTKVSRTEKIATEELKSIKQTVKI